MQNITTATMGRGTQRKYAAEMLTRPRLKTAECHQRHPEHRAYSRMINFTNRFIVSIWIGTVTKENISRCSASEPISPSISP